MSVVFGNKTAYYPGLISSLLNESYADIDTASSDNVVFKKFDAQVAAHPQWLSRCVYITTIDNHPIGFTSFDPRQKPIAYIGHNCILPKYRNKGLGRQQMNYLLASIRQQHFSKAVVSTRTSDSFASARKMYQGCGFQKTTVFCRLDNQQVMVGYELSLI